MAYGRPYTSSVTDKYSFRGTTFVEPAAAEIAAALPSEVAEAFLLVAGQGTAEQPAADLRAARTHLRAAVVRPVVFRVRPGEALRVSLRLAGYLNRQSEGWAREALAALGASVASRTDAEGRRALVRAAAAVDRGLADLGIAGEAAA